MSAEAVRGPALIDTDDQSARWLRADLFGREDAADECGLLLDEADVTEAWFTCRWTTEEERADEDRLHDLFGMDWEDYDTSVYVEECPAGTDGAIRYWRVVEVPTTRADGPVGRHGELVEGPDGKYIVCWVCQLIPLQVFARLLPTGRQVHLCEKHFRESGSRPSSAAGRHLRSAEHSHPRWPRCQTCTGRGTRVREADEKWSPFPESCRDCGGAGQVPTTRADGDR